MKRSTMMNFLRAFIILLLPLGAVAQTATISGKVSDSNGEALIGVNVSIQGTTIGTVTDIDGKYRLTGVPQSKVTIVASFIGFITENFEADLTGTSTFSYNFTLLENIEELDEVVVIGYGVQKKSDLTSSVASVSAEDLQNARSANVSEALQGRAAGVTVSNNTGAPGSGVSVKIRGITSINGTDPIWIVDGVQRDPNTVNASDIESMEILKDASSAAIYGANAGSGVILVTTKKGKAGDTKVTFNAFYGVQKRINEIDVLNTPDFHKMYHEMEVLSSKRANQYIANKPEVYQQDTTFDYQDMVFRKAIMQSYDISVSGGNEKSTFYMGAAYINQEGIVKNSDYNKVNVTLNGDHKANSWFTVGANVNYTRQQRNGLEDWQLINEYHSPINFAIQFHPFVNPYTTKKTNSEYDEGWSVSPLSNTMNPLAQIGIKHHKSTSHALSGTLYGVVSPIEGLKYESRINGNVSYNFTYDFTPIYIINASLQNQNPKISNSYSLYEGWNWQNLLSYSKTFFDSHNFSVLVGIEAGQGKSRYVSAERDSLINQTPEMWYFDASTDGTEIKQFPTGSGNESAGYSYLGRVSYDFRGMLLGQVNFRRDYSSKFGPNNRAGNFPSFSVGFKFTELDPIAEALPFMNFGKIRYGWGRVGNNAVDYYQYYATVAYKQIFGYAFDDENTSLGAAPNKNVNESIHWEEVETSNIGIDLGFLNNRLTASIDYFSRHNNGMLMTVQSPSISGWYVDSGSAPQEGGVQDATTNIGEFNNNGVEIQLAWKENRGKLTYGADFNMSFIKTKVDKISPDTIYTGSAQGLAGQLTRTISNSDFDIFYGYEVERLFRAADVDGSNADFVTNQSYTTDEQGNRVYAQPYAKAGDFKFKDVNGDGKITAADMKQLGTPHPKINIGFNLHAEYSTAYGDIDARAFFQGAYGHKVFNQAKYYLFNQTGSSNWGQDYFDNHYKTDMTDKNGDVVTVSNDATAKYPRLCTEAKNNGNFEKLSSFYVEKASYLRLKSFEIGYTLPKAWTKVVDIERVRIYYAANNLITWTKYSGLDPEVGGTTNGTGNSDPRTAGIDRGAYPTARMHTVGININF